MEKMDQDRDPLVSDQILINGHVTAVSLTAGVLQWSEGGSQHRLEMESQVLGFSIQGSRIEIKAVVEGGAGISCLERKRTLNRKTLVFEPLSEASLRGWCRKLQEYMDSLGRPKKLFIFMNPFGGRKSASKIFMDEVKPLLEDANVEFTLQETKYQLHAKEIALTLDLSKYDGIICVSGDGVLVEVLNGLLERGDWETAIRMPLGVVPAGTGNGMAKSLLDSVGAPCKASNAILAIIRGHKCKLDISTIIQGETKFFSALMLAWGLVADIDIESEKYRWMGSARIDFYALQRMLYLRKYSGSVLFAPAPGFEAFGEPCDQIAICCPSHKDHGYQGPEVDLESLSWRKITGPFVSVWLHNVPWGGEDTMAAPDAKFSDGYLDLIIIKDCPKLSLLKLMTELNDGGHVKSPYVLYLKVKAFVLEPGSQTADPTKEGIIDVDGEVLARGKGTYKCEHKSLMNYDKLQLTVHQGLATLFCPI